MTTIDRTGATDAEFQARIARFEGALRPDERWEWGVKHSQGIRAEVSERSARESLEGMTTAFERNFRNTVKPHIVRRRVSNWQTVEVSP